MKQWIVQVLVAFDQLLNTLFPGGWADETMSSRLYRLEKAGKPAGRYLRPIVDWAFATFFDWPQHCKDSYDAERTRSQLPPELRFPTRTGAAPQEQ